MCLSLEKEAYGHIVLRSSLRVHGGEGKYGGHHTRQTIVRWRSGRDQHHQCLPSSSPQGKKTAGRKTKWFGLFVHRGSPPRHHRQQCHNWLSSGPGLLRTSPQIPHTPFPSQSRTAIQPLGAFILLQEGGGLFLLAGWNQVSKAIVVLRLPLASTPWARAVDLSVAPRLPGHI